jgi:ribonuclease E
MGHIKLLRDKIMTKKILIDAKYPSEIRAVLVNKNNTIEEIEYETLDKEQIKGNIYLAKVSRIEPALQAAFITYENGKSGFLPFFEIHPDFFTIDTTKTTAESLKEIQVPEITPQEVAEKEELTSLADERCVDINDLISKDLEKTPAKVDFESVCDEIEDVKTQYQNLYKKYKIQDVIKRGQIILVQANKEPRGNKSASFTTFLSLAGKFCVLMPNTPKQNGISRRIINQEERKRLKNIVSDIVPNQDSNTSSLIVRTAGIDRTAYEIKKDYEYLARTWNKVRNSAIKITAPNVIHVEEDIIPKTIRDMLDDKVAEVIIQGEEQYKIATEFAKQILPNEVSKIVEHKGPEPIFAAFNVEEQIMNLYQPIAPLPSGGYVVINPTEALTSIDVNSGKAINEKHIEETALKTNIEAAIQIAKHIKLRDISGLIVIDFIDMFESKNRKLIEHTLKEALSRDKAKIQINHISSLGLIEISRQRLKPSFLEKNSVSCKYCNGKGIVRSDEANAMLMLRTVEKEILGTRLHSVNVFAHIDPTLYILNKKREDVERIQQEYGIELNFYHDKMATAESFYIEKIKLQKSTKRNINEEPELTRKFEHINNKKIDNIEAKDQVKNNDADNDPDQDLDKVKSNDKKRKNFRKKRKFVNKGTESQKPKEVAEN